MSVRTINGEMIDMPERFIGSELKPSYYRQSCKNLDRALSINMGLFAGSDEDEDESEEEFDEEIA